MKKIILLFAMMLAVGTVSAATQKYTTTSFAATGGTYTAETGVYAWNYTNIPSDNNNQRLQIFGGLKDNVNLSVYKYLHFNITALSTDGAFRVNICCNDNYGTAAYYSQDYTTTGEVTIDLTSLSLSDNNGTQSISTINRIFIQGRGTASGSLTISDVYLESADYETMKITTSLTSESKINDPINIYTTSESVWDNSTNFVNKIGQSVGDNAVIYGHVNGSRADIHFYVTGYDKIKVSLSTAAQNQVRFFGKSESEGNLTINTVSETTTYEADLNGLTTFYNVKSQNGNNPSNITISSIDFIKEFDENSTTAFNIAASNKSSIAYNRSFTSGQTATVCLPFALTSSEVSGITGTFYTLSSESDGVLKFTSVSATEAYKPYLFVASSNCTPFSSMSDKEITATPASCETTPDGCSYTFKGTLAASGDVAGDNTGKTVYGYSSDGTFVKVGSNVAVNAFRAYITVTTAGSARSLNVIFDDESTGIQSVNGSGCTVNGSDAYYNLSGQRVSQPTKGLYIVNGKKVVVK